MAHNSQSGICSFRLGSPADSHRSINAFSDSPASMTKLALRVPSSHLSTSCRCNSDSLINSSCQVGITILPQRAFLNFLPRFYASLNVALGVCAVGILSTAQTPSAIFAAMLTEIYIEALLVDKELADQVWDAWDSGESDGSLAAWA